MRCKGLGNGNDMLTLHARVLAEFQADQPELMLTSLPAQPSTQADAVPS